MRIISRRFVEGKPSAREITLGYTTMWFAGEHIIGLKYFGYISKNNPGTGYAGQIANYLPTGATHRMPDLISRAVPVYTLPQIGFIPKMVMFAGKSANAHMLNLGNAEIYFSYDKLIGFKAFDIMYITNVADNNTMRNHITNMITDRTGYITVSPEELAALAGRYFGQYERGISCVPNI